MNKPQCANIQPLFSPALDSCLEPAELMMFETHLRGCDSCHQDYERYARLFAAVASLSGSTMQGPVPYPQTVKAFRGSDSSSLPWWGRFGTTAAAAVLLAIVGFGAFQAGRQDDEGQSPDGEEVAEVEFVQPSELVAKELKGWHHDIEALPVLLEAASRYPGKTAQRALTSLIVREEARSRQFLALDRTSLGSLERPTKRIANDLILCLSEVVNQSRSDDKPAQFIHYARNRFQNATIVDRRNQLGHMVRGFAESEQEHASWQSLDPVAQELGLAVRWFVKGKPQQSRIHLNHLKPRLLNKSSTQLYGLIGELERVFIVRPDRSNGVFSLTLDSDKNGSWATKQGFTLDTHGARGQIRFSITTNGANQPGNVFEIHKMDQRRMPKMKALGPKRLHLKRAPAPRKPKRVVL
ncbi:MAG: hypothetical protein ACI97A_000267 [Planctomycetota bacterium]|jgi:hypothetical protein